MGAKSTDGSPSIDKTAFNCPHCGALAKQFWFSVNARELDKNGTPHIVHESDIQETDFQKIPDADMRKSIKARWERLAAGRPFFDGAKDKWSNINVENIAVAKCFNCDDISIWIFDRMVWPAQGEGPAAGHDLPLDVKADYDEASTILNLSPRGAAALLRLAIEKLCKQLGGKGDDLNADIADLVKRGLDVRVQRALDVVRVIGNHAVHPGQIDLKDDKGTAEKLFGLVNLITEIMITQPKHVAAMYGKLPEGARDAITRRDAKAAEAIKKK